MKKIALILGICGALTACSTYEANIDKAKEIRDENQRQYREDYGCVHQNDYDSYRQCLLDTYYKNSPKTFVPARTEDGKTLAIIRNDATSSYDPDNETYKTERVVVVETVETVPADTEVESSPVTDDVETASVEKKETEETKKQDETWWKNYQENHPKASGDKPQCPCPDPNEPCPQCVDK